ncbi:putative polysaccharide biosynthesis protein [Caryophanon tenue]|uniref:Uncharacterized protein n=1 Tax=Caryophanon tenue TaxID=33978 RepID=A0A1C0YCG4_9BACL|nr:polysaccharide biosynthesis protein [Caryophanon tenue]OCS84819.1 hypothetical protein A6M13_14800 [Caryophanon tenue]
MADSWGMKGYMKGAALLTISALIVKILGAMYRVPFQNLVGDEGFYIYQQVYPFISIFVTWTASGFAVAISKLLADADTLPTIPAREARRLQLMQIAFWYLVGLSMICFMILFAGASTLANLMGDPQLAPLMRTGSFVVLCMPVLAILKGSFQARGRMEPVAYAQIVEQAVRVSIILIGSWLVMKYSGSLYDAGQVATAATAIGEFIGVILLLFLFKRFALFPKVVEQQQKIRVWPVVKELTLYSLSVSMSGLVLLCFQMVDSFTVYSALLESGLTETVAKETKGIYDRGQPLVQLGVVIASSLSLVIVPLVAIMSKKSTGRNADSFIQLTYRASILFGWAAAFGLILVMPNVNTMLFKTDSLTLVLSIFVLQIIPLSITLTFTAMLQGFGKLKIPALILAIGFLLKVIGNVTLVPLLGVLGAAVASNIGLFTIALLLIAYLKRVKPMRLAPLSYYKKLFIASAAMAMAVYGWSSIAENIISFSERLEGVLIGGSSIAIGAFVFITIVAKLKVLADKEWFVLPFGRKMAKYQLWLNRKK